MAKHISDNASADKPDVAAPIGPRLKSLRTEAKLSLEQLSKRSGVSRGMLNQIELGRSVPTITVLSRIAASFELPVAAFLATEQTSRPRVLKRSDANMLHSPDGRFMSRALFPFHGPRRTEFYELTLEPGCDYASDAHPTGTSENVVVSSGSMQIEIGSETYLLAGGDAVLFIADLPHTYRNRGPDTTLAYLVMTYPQSVSY